MDPNRKRPFIPLGDIVCGKLLLVALPQPAATPDLFRKAGARDVFVLRWDGPAHPERHKDHVCGRFNQRGDISKHNCSVAILNGLSTGAVWRKRRFSKFSTILFPADLSLLLALSGFYRYGRKWLSLVGETSISLDAREKRYFVFERVPRQKIKVLYGPTGLTPLEILSRFSDLDYVLLRWVENVESGSHEGDLDLLVAHDSLAELRARLADEVGTYPLDVYSAEGGRDHQYKTVPYFFPEMAGQILASAVVRESGVRIPSPRWRFLSFCYHLLFHKTARGVLPKSDTLGEGAFHTSKYADELARLAELASEPTPRSFDDLEKVLRKADVMPSIDTIGFYSAGNRFLRDRYRDRESHKPGLCVFYLRDFGHGAEPVEKIRANLAEKFEILAEGPVNALNEPAVLRNVRGGNWRAESAPNGVAKPVYWFVCWDPKPAPPSRETRQQHPRVDNENIRFKLEIRSECSAVLGASQRIIHSSDNTSEARDHILHLGLANHPEIMSRGVLRR